MANDEQWEPGDDLWEPEGGDSSSDNWTKGPQPTPAELAFELIATKIYATECLEPCGDCAENRILLRRVRQELYRLRGKG